MLLLGLILALAAVVIIGWAVLPIVLVALGFVAIRRLLFGPRTSRSVTPSIEGHAGAPLPTHSRRGCPSEVKSPLRRMEKRLETTHQQCQEALTRRLGSELARARVAPPLEDAYQQMRSEIDAIYAFCERNDLAGTLAKANRSTSARDIYLEAYQRDLAKVQAAMGKTEECLAAYERTVATLEVSSVDSDLGSDFDSSIEMLRDLREELPLYSLEDHI